MKKLLFISAIIFLHNLAFAQIGIFKTYEDFLNNKVEEYHDYHATKLSFGKFTVVFLDENDNKIKIKIDQEEMWGYRRRDDEIVRIDHKNNPNVIITTGKIILYGNYSTVFNANGVQMNFDQYPPKISAGLDDKMMVLNKKNLRKLLKGDSTSLSKLSNTDGQTQDLMNFVFEYNSK